MDQPISSQIRIEPSPDDGWTLARKVYQLSSSKGLTEGLNLKSAPLKQRPSSGTDFNAIPIGLKVERMYLGYISKQTCTGSSDWMERVPFPNRLLPSRASGQPVGDRPRNWLRRMGRARVPEGCRPGTNFSW
eukprot:1124748-Rhodomonas_salina.1